MKCVSFQRRLHAILDQRLPLESDAELAKHAWQCCECRQVFVTQQRILDVLGTATAVAPADLAARVVQATTCRAVPRRWGRVWMAGAVAASLLIVLIPVSIYRASRDAGSPATPLVAPAAASSTPLAAVEPPPASLSAGYQQFLASLVSQLDGVQRLGPVGQLTGAVRPITNSFGVAIDALRKSFPVKSKG
jgi:hypothetical protein